MLKTLIESRDAGRQTSVSHVWISVGIHAAIFFLVLSAVEAPEPVYVGKIKQVTMGYAVHRPMRLVKDDSRGVESAPPKLEKVTPIPDIEEIPKSLAERLKIDPESLHLAGITEQEGEEDGVEGGHGAGNGLADAVGLGDGEVAVVVPVAAEYPPNLWAARISGEVSVLGIIDTEGKVEPESFRVLGSTDPRFEESVRRAFTKSRYTSGRVDGLVVRVMVCQRFVFRVDPSGSSSSLARSMDCPLPRSKKNAP